MFLSFSCYQNFKERNPHYQAYVSESNIVSIFASPDGERAAVMTSNGSLIRLDLISGNLSTIATGHTKVSCRRLHPCTSLLASRPSSVPPYPLRTSRGWSFCLIFLSLFHTYTYTYTHFLSHSHPLSVSPRLRLSRDTDSPQPVTAAASAARRSQIATASRDGTVRIWTLVCMSPFYVSIVYVSISL